MGAVIVRPDQGPKEDPVREFIWLLSQYQWNKPELRECGVIEEDFRRMVRLLRFALIRQGYVVV